MQGLLYAEWRLELQNQPLAVRNNLLRVENICAEFKFNLTNYILRGSTGIILKWEKKLA